MDRIERELDREMKGAAIPMKQSQPLIKKLRKKSFFFFWLNEKKKKIKKSKKKKVKSEKIL